MMVEHGRCWTKKAKVSRLQWLYLDAMEAVPGQWTVLDNAKVRERETWRK